MQEPLANEARAVVLRDGSVTPEMPEMPTLRRQDGTEAAKNDGVKNEEEPVRRHTLWDGDKAAKNDGVDTEAEDRSVRRDTVWDPTDKHDRQQLDRPRGDAPQDPDPVGMFAPEMRRETGLGYRSRASPAYVKAPGYVKVAPAPGTALNAIATSVNPSLIAVKQPYSM